MKRTLKNMIAKHRKCFMILTILLVYILLLYNIAPSKMTPKNLSKHPLFEAQNISEYKIKNNFKVILIWTRIQATYDQWNLVPGPISLSIKKEMPADVACHLKNCVVTYDKGHLEHSDAVLLSLYDLKVFLALGPTLALIIEVVTFGAIDIYSSDGLPPYKPKGQKWVLYWAEPPNILFRYIRWTDILAPLDNLIDWTVSFRQDSTISRPYCYSISRETHLANFMKNYTGRLLPKTVHPTESRSSVIASSAPLKSTKIVKIIWFVSNCDSASKREDFVKLLSQQENIQVDIYGACGTLKCSRKSADFCFQTLLPKYDFYLSLENEVCPDYVTEKLCKIFKHNIVPVVLGGADYSQMAPPHSVINVADFKDLNDLSKHLRLMVDNPEEYNRYFEWKKTHFIEQRIQPFFACDICSKLNQPDHVKPVKLSDWWNQRKCLDSWKDLMTI